MNRCIIYIFLALSFFNGQSQNSKLSIAKKADWVKSTDHKDLENYTSEAGYGYFYHLIDHQANIDKQSYFSHYSVELLNNEGVQQISDINIDFDPTFQKLIFHSINIIRNGRTIKKLSLNTIKTVQREANMERFLYDGTLTAFVNLTDVRIGDILDYSYTIIGSNPIYEDKYHGKLYFQYSIPVGYLYNRILISDQRKLNFKYFNNASPANVVKDNGINEYIWKNEEIKPLIYDINTPSWYNPTPQVSISEYNSWQEISNQYTKHYTLSNSEQKKIKKKAIDLFSNTTEDSIVSKIRKFVQDDVRYLGFEGGLNSHKPDNPVNVLQQRYGDCKAKSFLLVELYKAFNIEAYPILVSSNNGVHIIDELPSPNLFNHCIVQVKFGEETSYIDPTISNQGGTLENLYVPKYHNGLVLKTDENELSEINSTTNNAISIIEEFTIDSIGGGGKFSVITKYSGYTADDQRTNFAKKNIDKIQKEYINFYSALYPSITELDKVTFIDNRESKNELTVYESYYIDSLWTKSNTNDKVLNCEFYPLSIEPHVNLTKSPSRTMPYYVQYPVDIEHQILVNLPEEWPIKQENKIIRGSSFVYSYDINYADQTLELYHTYKTSDNHVNATETSSFIAKHEKILNELTYMITYDTGYIKTNSGVSLILILISLITIIISIYFSIKIYKHYNLINHNVSTDHMKIGGWLILVAIGLTITPIRVLWEILINYKDFYSTNTWEYIYQNHTSFGKLFHSLLIFFELLYNSAFIVFATLLVILFYKKRNIVPKLMIVFYTTTLLITILDTAAAFALIGDVYSEAEKVESFKDIFKSFVGAAIWIPYFILSKRVKSTFTEIYQTEKAL